MIEKITIRECSNNCTASHEFIKKFHNLKLDSLVCRLPPSLMNFYFDEIRMSGGKILAAFLEQQLVGILIFLPDSNITLRFIKKNKFKIMFYLLSTKSFSDKNIFISNIMSFVLSIGRKLPEDFKNEISLLAVDVNFRSIGIGALLVKYLFKMEFGEINVKTHSNNFGAIKFYTNNGFSILKLIKFAGHSFFCFQKK